MKLKNVFLFSILTISFIVIGLYFFDKKYAEKTHFSYDNTSSASSLPVSLEVYKLIEDFSTKYGVPKYIAYNIAFLETRYQGPFDWNYNPYRTSSVGAEGPMQIMPSTANYINNENVSNKVLRTDLSLNIETSMKLLKSLYNQYNDWSIVCGFYNTGFPIVNDYALFCLKTINYRDNWVSPN